MMDVMIKRFVTGPIDTNSYIVSDSSSSCLIVDPSSGCDELFKHIDDNNLVVEAICLTHGHFDHCMGIEEILGTFPETPVFAHPAEAKLLRDPQMNGSWMLGVQFAFTGAVQQLHEGHMRIGSFALQVLDVSGHSPGGCAFVFDGHCICGDAVFAGSIGRTDLAGADGDRLLRNIREKLLTLPDETVLYPGHGGRTTVAREKRMNPFLQQP
jgi:glyoxylase-like metal-dependent hydrolase (beta-lactamase superfamily II)